MPRSYNKKCEKKYTKENLMLAVKAVKAIQDGQTVWKAAKTFEVPTETLR